jgi:hypothetical protein
MPACSVYMSSLKRWTPCEIWVLVSVTMTRNHMSPEMYLLSSGSSQTFRRNVLLKSSGSKSKPSKRAEYRNNQQGIQLALNLCLMDPCCHPWKHSGNYMYHVHKQKFGILPAWCIYMFNVIIGMNSEYFPEQNLMTRARGHLPPP